MARPLEIHAPAGSVVNANFPAAVAGGNVETSQRIVDVVLRALARAVPDRIPAASCGSMNNIALGGQAGGRVFSYYETLAGGAGASAMGPGRIGAPHAHDEHHEHADRGARSVLSAAHHALRRAQRIGRARALQPAGNGLVREIEFLSAARVTLLTERRSVRPYGLAGRTGRPCRQERIDPARTAGAASRKTSLDVVPGDRLSVETPGGGGFGRPPALSRSSGRQLPAASSSC
jgi:N-methylhydantoinase B